MLYLLITKVKNLFIWNEFKYLANLLALLKTKKAISIFWIGYCFLKTGKENHLLFFISNIKDVQENVRDFLVSGHLPPSAAAHAKLYYGKCYGLDRVIPTHLRVMIDFKCVILRVINKLIIPIGYFPFVLDLIISGKGGW